MNTRLDAERGSDIVQQIAELLDCEPSMLQVYVVMMLVLGLVRCGVDLDEFCIRVRHLARELHKAECAKCRDSGELN